MTRHRNNGLRKYWRLLSRRNWAKCPHALASELPVEGDALHRFSLNRHLGRNITSRTEAETEAERLRLAIKDGTFEDPTDARAVSADRTAAIRDGGRAVR